jgi:hypothetical protein
MVNQDGIELKEGMKVKGYITFRRSYGRIGDKDVEGIIVEWDKQLFVQSTAEPTKFYKLSKFAHNWLTQPEVAMLEVQ